MVMDKEVNVFTVKDYLINKVKFEIPSLALKSILADRGLMMEEEYDYADPNTLKLAYADMLKWFILGPSKVNNTSDSDNGWTHAGGGYDMSNEDRAELKAEANAIYKELEPTSMLVKKTSFKISSNGVKRANYSSWGSPLPHIIK